MMLLKNYFLLNIFLYLKGNHKLVDKEIHRKTDHIGGFSI